MLEAEMSRADLSLIARPLRLAAPRYYGQDVREWQKFIGAYPDGDYGKDTAKTTVVWKVAQGLPAIDLVDAETLAAAKKVQQAQPVPSVGPAGYPFIPARFFTKIDRSTEIGLVVMHCGELVERPYSAEAMGKYFASMTDEKHGASAHYGVDCDSVVQYVEDRYKAWHAPGSNTRGIGIELTGYAKQTRDEWLDAYGIAMLELAAQLVAEKCKQWVIPVSFVGPDELATQPNVRGITTHRAVSAAFKVKGGHTDPGPNFPMDFFIARTVEHYNQLNG